MRIWKLAGKVPYLVAAFCYYMLAEGMWEPGSWEWGVLGTAFLLLGLIFNNWGRIIDVIPNVHFVSDDSESQKQGSGIWQYTASIVFAICVLPLIILTLPGPEQWQWTHPALSESEAQKAESECLMKSVEVITSKGPLMASYTGREREEYVDLCMNHKGFKKHWLDE